MSASRWIVRVAVVTLILTVCAGGWYVYHAIAVSLRAERALHAMVLVTTVVERYVDQTGRWPHSWEELEAVECHDQGMFSWPEDSAEVQLYVEVDFDAELSGIASQTLDEFDAIRPIGPCYEYRDRAGTLIETVRQRLEHGVR